MSKRLKRMSRISLFAFITIIFVSFTASQTVLGITDFDQQRKIPAGYEDAFTHTINNYKNQSRENGGINEYSFLFFH